MNPQIAITTPGIGRRICEGFGLDPTLISCISLEFMPGDIVYATITRTVTNPEVNDIIETIQQYRLEPIGSPDNQG